MNIPIFMTLIRIILIPCFIIAFYLPMPLAPQIAALLFSVAAITDGLDGYFARHLNQVSPFGIWLDPIADKLMVTSALILLSAHHTAPALVIPAIIIIGREITVSALREWMAILGESSATKVSRLGKFKTLMQILSIILLLLGDPEAWTVTTLLGYSLLYTAMVLTLTSFLGYLQAVWKVSVRKIGQ